MELVLTPYEDIVDDTIDEDGNKVQFKFNELSEVVKEKLRDKLRDSGGYLEYEWWDNTYEDAATIAKLMGIEIGTRTGTYTNGKPWSQPDIYFSGFSSQGDGCCYAGELSVAGLPGSVERVIAHTSAENKDLIALATQAEALYTEIQVRLVAIRMGAVEAEDEDDDNSGSEVRLDSLLPIGGNDRFYRTAISSDWSYPEDIDKSMDSYVSAFADWIYERLEQEHDYLMSDECVDEALKSGDALYDEDGDII